MQSLPAFRTSASTMNGICSTSSNLLAQHFATRSHMSHGKDAQAEAWRKEGSKWQIWQGGNRAELDSWKEK